METSKPISKPIWIRRHPWLTVCGIAVVTSTVLGVAKVVDDAVFFMGYILGFVFCAWVLVRLIKRTGRVG